MKLYTISASPNYSTIASTYGSGSYGGCTYDCTSNAAAAGTNGGGLANTGIAVAAVVTVAAVVLLAAVLVRFWRRPGKKYDARRGDSSDDPSQRA